MSLTTRKVVLWPIDNLVPYEKNAKKHPPEQIAKIAASIKSMGFNPASAISVDKDGVIINGHGRRLAAISLGMKEVPVVVCDDLTPEQVRAYRLVDNKVAEGLYDTELMAEELSALVNDDNFDMSLFFDDRELDFAIEDLGDIDMNAVTHNLAEEVDSHSESTQNSIDAESSRMVPLSKVFGFSQVNAVQQRALARLLALAEGETGETGAEALSRYATEFMGV